MADIIIFFILLVITFITGTLIEKKHLKSLEMRENTLPKVPVINFDRHTFNQPVETVNMLSANAVIGADYFKTVLSNLVSIFGGNISAIENVLQRARREAVIRLKQQSFGADFLANLRYETTILTDASSRNTPKVEIYAYATAIYLKK